MKSENCNRDRGNAKRGTAFLKLCRACGRKVLAQLDTVRTAVFKESFDSLDRQEHLLRLVLNEAEALAWQTKYPHLVFPTLATEKVQAVAAWNRHQRFVRRTSPVAVPAG